MAGSIFKSRFGKDSREFSTTEEIDRFIEEQIGHKLPIEYMHLDVSSSRGSIFKIEDKDASEIFKKALAK